ncbi:MAG: sulfatase-like hydrolase/transferase [Actinomycetota bacterium]
MASEVTTEDAGAGSSGGSRGVVVFGRRVPAGLWWALAELFALTGLAIAQPLLDVTGKAPDFFLLHRSDRTQILLLMALVVLAPAAGLWAGEALTWLLGGERARRLVHLVLVTGLFCVLALEVAKKLTPLQGRRLLLAALVVGVAAGLVYARWAAVRLWLRYLAPAPLVFALVFATLSPTAELILPRSAGNSPVPVRTHPDRPLPPVVMVLFDEFPLQSLLDSSGHIDRRVYPNFAGFADQATWYRNATGIGGWTPFAVPSMLSGTWPTTAQRGAVPDHSGWPNNLFTLLDRHYRLKVFETVTQLCPGQRCGQTGTRSGFATVARQTAKLYRTITSPRDSEVDPASVGEDPTLGQAAPDSAGPQAYFGNLKLDQINRVDRFVDSISAGDPQPTLYFLHVLLPHQPFKYLADGKLYNSRSMGGVSGVWPSRLLLLNQQRHLIQLAWTDKVIARVLQRLKDQGLYDKSLVVMTADHGEGFTPGNPRRLLAGGNAAQLMWVPMLIKAPGQTKGRVDDRNWEHVDLLPTIADTVGLSIPWKVDGLAQTGPPGRQSTDKTFYNHPGQPLHRPGPPNFATVLHGVTDTLVRAHQHGDRGFWQYGPTADWIYQPPQRLGRIGGPPASAKIRDWALFQHLDPDAAAVPALVVGELTGPAPAGATVVAAVNGQVAATSGLFPMQEGQPANSFAALVPDFLYRPGPGPPQLQLYLSTGTGSGTQLQPVSIESGT